MMRHLAAILAILWIFLLAGCQPPRETLLRANNRDVVFSITLDPAVEGKPINHYIAAILPDGSVADKTLLCTNRQNQSDRFEVMDNGSMILILAKKDNRKTLWMIYTVGSAHFENPRDMKMMMAIANQRGLSMRDPSILNSL